jgi:hypothetical protein
MAKKSGGGGGGGGGGGVRGKALSEFRFLNQRLAAGHLKRGERKAITRRQESLAKTVFGVK